MLILLVLNSLPLSSFAAFITEINSNAEISESNGVLAHYQSFSKDINGVTYSHDSGSNELRISVSENNSTNRTTFNTRDYGIYELMPNGAAYNSGTMSNYVYFEFTNGNVQNLMFSNFIDPSTFSVPVEVQSGKLQVKKVNAYGNPVADCNFDLYSNEACTQKVGSNTSDGNGQLLFDKLKPGTYWVKETSVPTGYLLDTSTKEAHRVPGLEEGKTYKLIEKTAPYGYELTEEIEFTVSEDKET